MYNYYEVVQELQRIYSFLNNDLKALLIVLIMLISLSITFNLVRWFRSK